MGGEATPRRDHPSHVFLFPKGAERVPSHRPGRASSSPGRALHGPCLGVPGPAPWMTPVPLPLNHGVMRAEVATCNE